MLPTWAIAFDRRDKTAKVPMRFGKGLYHADNDNSSRYYLSRDPNVLALGGFLVDSVAQYSDVIRTGNRSAFEEFTAATMLRQLQNLCTKSSCGIKGLAHTLIDGLDWQQGPAGAREIDDYDAFRSYIATGARQPPFAEYQRDHAVQRPLASRYFHTLNRACFKGRRLFISQKGFIGLGHPLMKPEDVVVIFAGGKFRTSCVQHILRPAGTNGYAFVAECYVYGVMDGGYTKARVEAGESMQQFFLVWKLKLSKCVLPCF